MFIVEGLPASIVGLFVLMMLSDRPEEAAWLSVEERAAMGAMLAEEQRDRARHSLLSAIKDVRVLILTGIQFGYTPGSYGIGIWLPQILKTHGLSNLAIRLCLGNTVSVCQYRHAGLGGLCRPRRW